MELTEARAMATSLMDRHGLSGWTFKFDSAKRRAGLCRFDDHVISMSRALVQLYSPERTRETLLHEIAHALAGPNAGHGPRWQAIARSIGSTGERLVEESAPQVEAPWLGMCPAGHRHTRFRRPTRPASCRKCSPTFSLDHLLTWTFHGEVVDLGPRYEAQIRRARALVAMNAPSGSVRRLASRLGGSRTRAAGNFRDY